MNLDFTPENMYFWGFLWADAHFGIQREPYWRVSLEIVKSDMDNIDNIIPNWMNRSIRKRKNRQEQACAYTGRQDFCDFLKDHGYINKQSPSKDILNHKYANYWFRGVVDGDGCWYFNQKNYLRQFSITSNYDQDWAYFIDLLNSLKCNFIFNQHIQKNGNKFSRIRMTNKDNLNKLFQYLYPNGYDFGLKRKYDKALLCR